MVSASVVNATIPASVRSVPNLSSRAQLLIETLKTKSKAEIKALCGVSGMHVVHTLVLLDVGSQLSSSLF